MAAAPSSSNMETFTIGPFTAPRLWTGLWQLSSNAWGSASVSKVRQGMARHVQLGYTAFGTLVPLTSPTSFSMPTQTWYVSLARFTAFPDGIPSLVLSGYVSPPPQTIPHLKRYPHTADHYGSAEVIFVRPFPSLTCYYAKNQRLYVPG